MLTSSFFSAFWITILAQSALSQNTALKCPGFMDKIEAFLNFTIDNTTFSDCFSPPQSAICSFRPINGSIQTLCSSSVTQCDQTSTRCKCVEERQDGYKYILSFIPQSVIHTNGSFFCEIDCTVLGGGSRPTINIDQSCTNINIIEPSTTVATTFTSTKSAVKSSSAFINTASTATSTEPPSNTSSSKQILCEEIEGGCIAIIVIFVLVGIGIISCSICCFAIVKERKIDVPDNRNVTEKVKNIQYQKSGCNKLTIEQSSNSISIKGRNIIPLCKMVKKVKDIVNKDDSCLRNTGTGHGMEMSDSKPS